MPRTFHFLSLKQPSSILKTAVLVLCQNLSKDCIDIAALAKIKTLVFGLYVFSKSEIKNSLN